ncbi:ABC transporter permease subunit [Streptomyces sp. NPDC047042]|uniref:ABC transporter permease n=1 Tax=Streptomyces sp. NPDC047042 TaxID=3154807 RepID=UPI003406278D
MNGRVLSALTGVAVLLAVMESAGRLGLAGSSFPPLSEVVGDASQPMTRMLLGRAVDATLGSSLEGLLIGSAAGLLLAALGHLIAQLSTGLDRLSVLVASLPLPALGPLFIASFGAQNTPVVIAALGAGFGMFVAVTSGLSSVSRTQQDVFTALGGTRATRLRLLELPTAVPWLLDGLALGGPAAVLGATIGEWFGASRGLGVVVISSLQNVQTTLLWAAALAITLLSLVAYAIPSALRGVAVRRYR